MGGAWSFNDGTKEFDAGTGLLDGETGSVGGWFTFSARGTVDGGVDTILLMIRDISPLSKGGSGRGDGVVSMGVTGSLLRWWKMNLSRCPGLLGFYSLIHAWMGVDFVRMSVFVGGCDSDLNAFRVTGNETCLVCVNTWFRCCPRACFAKSIKEIHIIWTNDRQWELSLNFMTF